MIGFVRHISVFILLAAFTFSAVGVDIYRHVCGHSGEEFITLYYQSNCSDHQGHHCSMCLDEEHKGCDCLVHNGTNSVYDTNLCRDYSEQIILDIPYVMTVVQFDLQAPEFNDNKLLLNQDNDYKDDDLLYDKFYEPDISPPFILHKYSCMKYCHRDKAPEPSLS